MAEVTEIREVAHGVCYRINPQGRSGVGRHTRPGAASEGESVADRTCTICDWLPVYAQDRCEPCYRYRRRVGHDRPIALVIRHGEQAPTGKRPRRKRVAA